MARLINLVNQRFGRLLVIKREQNNNRNQTQWLCECDCGNNTIVQGSHLRSGGTSSCGCFKKEINKNSKNNLKHGMRNSSEYSIWRNMITRCTNLNNKDLYIVCKRWLNSFENFYEDMGPRPGLEYSIDRINNNKGYTQSNCKWSTSVEQSQNRSSNKIKSMDEANYIRELYKSGKYTQKEIAESYECTQANIGYVVTNKTWKITN